MNLLQTLARVSSMTLVSRILGFARDAIIARAFGAGMATDAFFVAFKLPNLLRRIFAEGAFSQAFVPLLVEYRKQRGTEETRLLINRTGTALGAVVLLVALLGPSTTHRNLVESGHTLYALTSGPHNWSHAISPRFRHLNYYNASDTLGRNFTGNNYGLDSDPISNQVTRIAAIKASNAGIVIWNSGRGAVGDFVAGQTVAGYCDPVKAGLLDLATSGKVIIWENLWPRHTLAGGIWASGGEGRSLLLQVNAHMAAWCFDNGITVADVWSIMVDQTDPDLNPKANYYTSDGIHYAAAGAYQVGVYYAGLMAALCAAPSTYDHTEVANIAPSATMTGTAGDATGNGASGTAPDNWTVSRGSVGNARSLTASIESIGGANYVVLTLGSSGTVAAAGEGGTLRPTTTPTLALLTVNNWYQARCTLICDNWAGWSGFKLLVSDNNGTVNGAAALTPGSGAGGETPVTGFTGSNQYAIRPDARTLILTSMPFKAGATGCTIRFNFNYVNASGGAVIKVGKFDLRQVSDPATII